MTHRVNHSFAYDLLFIFFLSVFAIITRTYDIERIPLGFHGDEAWTGLDALRILKEGYIGPYVGSALGQPAGPLYFVALVGKFFPLSISTVRLSMAFFGILTIPSLYILLRIHFSKYIAFFSTLAFCFSLMHLHFSRLGFMLIIAPFFEILALLFWSLYEKQKNIRYLVLTGILSALGLYTYNAFTLFTIGISIYVMIYLYRSRNKSPLLSRMVIYTATLLIVSLPFMLFVGKDVKNYFSHTKTISITNLGSFKEAQTIHEKAFVVMDNGVRKVGHFLFGGKIDFADGYGTSHGVEKYVIFFAVVGIYFVFRRKKSFQIFLVFLLLLMWIPAFTTVDGTYRRSFLALPLVFILAAFGVNYLYHNLFMLHRYKYLSGSVFAILVIVFSFMNISYYFHTYPSDGRIGYVFSPELTTAIQVASNFSPGGPVYLYADRWGCTYETARFLAAFECRDTIKNSSPIDLTMEAMSDATVAILLIGPALKYKNELPAFYKRYDIKEVKIFDQTTSVLFVGVKK